MVSDFMKIALIGLVIWLVMGQQPITTIDGGAADDVVLNCGVDPTVTLLERDKFDGTLPNGADVQYKINGGAQQTDADGSFSAPVGSTITVLAGYDNRSVYTRRIYSYNVAGCGVQTPNTYTELVQNTSMTVQCFNEGGDLISSDGLTYNETMATGDSVSLNCEIQGVSRKGLPEGGVVVMELSKTTYEEDLSEISGSVIGSKLANVPASYTLSSTSNIAYAWDVNEIVGAGNRQFTVSFSAEDDQNPAAGNDVTVTFYGKGGYVDEEDGDAFKIGVDDEDQTAVVGVVGAETIYVE